MRLAETRYRVLRGTDGYVMAELFHLPNAWPEARYRARLHRAAMVVEQRERAGWRFVGIVYPTEAKA